MSTTTDSILYALERARQSALNDAAALAEMGQSDESVYQDGIAQGLAQALDIVRNPPDGRGIFV